MSYSYKIITWRGEVLKLNLRDRLSNYGLWVSVFALLGMILEDFFGITLVKEQYELYTNSILTILVLLGLVNNPTNGKWYKD